MCLLHTYFTMLMKFMFSKKATKINEIFTVNLTLCSRRQIDGEDLVDFCGLLKKHELLSKQFYESPKNCQKILKMTLRKSNDPLVYSPETH